MPQRDRASIFGLHALASIALASAFVVSCKRSSTSGDAGAITAPPDAGPEGGPAFVSAAAALASAVGTGSARPLAGAASAGAAVAIPAGTFPSGSAQGDEGRDPSLEPALADVTLGAFSIDALPYPNDPLAPARLGATREEAAAACAERGARLCSELEWERACKGPANDTFATGAAWNDACDKSPSLCASGYGARAMGFLREWTSSTFEGAPYEGAEVLRGGAGTLRRCAARSRPSPRSRDAATDVGFRCCRGAQSGVRVPASEARPAFRKTAIDAAELAKIVASIPELARIGGDIRLFGEPDVKQILARGGAAREGITFAPSPILWSPDTGVELLVATGRGKSTGFVVALWTLPGGKYRFASSFLLLNEVAPIVLAYEPSRRKELRWTSCWGCAGEQGAVSYRDDHRVVIVQH